MAPSWVKCQDAKVASADVVEEADPEEAAPEVPATAAPATTVSEVDSEKAPAVRATAAPVDANAEKEAPEVAAQKTDEAKDKEESSMLAVSPPNGKVGIFLETYIGWTTGKPGYVNRYAGTIGMAVGAMFRNFGIGVDGTLFGGTRLVDSSLVLEDGTLLLEMDVSAALGSLVMRAMTSC